jgi:poly(hydroxyalkanoate) depolymerase family esterase
MIALIMLLVGALPASAQGVDEVTGFGSNPGNLRMFRYVPSGLTAGRPVVVALHGCTQNAAGYGTNAGWVELAERWNFAVVLPQQQSLNNISMCFNWFQSGDITRGQGEVESIAQMTRRTITDTGANPDRVYVTGLSAGGGMTAAMLATYPDMFTGGGIVAGLPYACATSILDAFSCQAPGKNLTPAQWGNLVRSASSYTGPWPSVSIWQGTADFTVAPANARELEEQWTNVGSAVDSHLINGMGHGQPVDPGTGDGQCGHATAFVLDVNVCAAWELGEGWGLAG